jgi:hypothetical protein
VRRGISEKRTSGGVVERRAAVKDGRMLECSRGVRRALCRMEISLRSSLLTE